MARDLMIWGGLILALCAGAALVLSPTGPAEPRAAFVEPPRTARAVAIRLHRAHHLARALTVRDSILRQAERSSSDQRVQVYVGRGLPSTLRDGLTRGIEQARGRLPWNPDGARLIVVVLADTAKLASEVSAEWYGMSRGVLLPRATDGRTCLVIVSVGQRGLALSADGVPNAAEWLLTPWWRGEWNTRYESSLLGPCAFYAAFGAPGRHVQAWLDSADHWPAFNAWWVPGTPLTPQPPPPARTWWRRTGRMFRFEPLLEGCAAGWRERCRDIVFGPATAVPWRSSSFDVAEVISVPGVLNTGRLSRGAHHALGETGVNLLSDLAAEIGPERFARFWRTDGPVDAAFAAATGWSVEEWAMRWARREVGRIPRGPITAPASALLALMSAAAVVAGAAALSQRREVR